MYALRCGCPTLASACIDCLCACSLSNTPVNSSPPSASSASSGGRVHACSSGIEVRGEEDTEEDTEEAQILGQHGLWAAEREDSRPMAGGARLEQVAAALAALLA